MPKIKTRKSVSKRIKVTGSGKILRMKSFSGCKHIRSNKTHKQVRGYRKPCVADDTDAKRISKLVPYDI